MYAGGAGAVYAVAEGALYSDVACVVHVFRMLLMLCMQKLRMLLS